MTTIDEDRRPQEPAAAILPGLDSAPAREGAEVAIPTVRAPRAKITKGANRSAAGSSEIESPRERPAKKRMGALLAGAAREPAASGRRPIPG